MRTTTWSLVLVGSLLFVPPVEGGKKKDKKKNKDDAAVESPYAGTLATVEDHLLAWETKAARSAIDPIAGEADAQVLCTLGRVLSQEGSTNSAVQRLQEAAALAPADPAPPLHLGEALLAADRQGDARAAFQDAQTRAQAILAANAEDPAALYALGVAQQRLTKYDDAVATLERLRAVDSGALPRFQLGATKAFQEKWAEAVDHLTAALEKDSGIAYAYYYRGLAQGRLGRADLMVNDLDRFLAMAPSAPEAAGAQQIVAAAGQ